MQIKKRHVISFLISALLLVFLFSRVDFGKVLDILKTANLLLFLTAVCLTIFRLSVEPLRWKVLLDAYKIKVRLFDVFSSFLASIFVANATPARLGDASRPYFLKRRYKTSFFNVLPAILVERAIDLIILLSYSALFLVLFSSMVSPILMVVLVLTFLIIALMLLVFFNKKLSNALINVFFRFFSVIGYVSRLKPRVKKFINKFYEGTNILKSANFPTIVLITAFVWFIEALTLFTVASSLGVSLPLLLCLGFTSLAVLGGTVSSLPGGLGSTEIILFGFLVLSGFSEPISLSITLLHRFSTFGICILFTSIFFIREVKS